MNEIQKRIIMAVTAIIAAMLIYPPFQWVNRYGVIYNMGYGWLLDPPRHEYIRATVNVTMLLTQWIAVVLIGGLAFFLTKNRPDGSDAYHQSEKNRKNIAQLANIATMPEDPHYSLVGVKGWLLVLCITLTILSPLLGIGVISSEWQLTESYFAAFPGLQVAVIFEIVSGLALIGFSIYAGFVLWLVKPGAVEIAKSYLWVLLIYSFSIPLLIVWIADLPSEASERIVNNSYLTAIKNGLWIGIWLIYLNVSKRVRATYGM